MTTAARSLLLTSLVLLAAACGGTHQAARVLDDHDGDELQGNASAGLATRPPNPGVQAAFAARSYAPGAVAVLRLYGDAPSVRVAIFHAAAGRDGLMQGARMTPERSVRPAGALRVPVGAWPSGLYYARVVTPGRGTWVAPVVVRPAHLGAHRIAVVLPTNTWQAYNYEYGNSWYFNSGVTRIQLARPYLDAGVPPHYRGYDRGFLRWLVLHDVHVDFLTDDDLDRIGGDALARAYDEVVFSGHEEYVTEREFDATQRYRDLGGNLAFLSANNFFYKVVKRGDELEGRWRWRDLGRPEASLVGEQYVDWNHDTYPNRPYRVTRANVAQWLFRGTGLATGSTFGVYGIEVDATCASSPKGTKVLAEIPGIFGPGKSAQMTYYETPAGAKVFAAGVMNFGGSSLWPQVRTMVGNVIAHLREA